MDTPQVLDQLRELLTRGVETANTRELLYALLESSDDQTVEALGKSALARLKRSSRRGEQGSVYECAADGCGWQATTFKRLQKHVSKKKHCANLKVVKTKYYEVLRDAVVESFKVDEDTVAAANTAFANVCDLLERMHPADRTTISQAEKSALEQRMPARKNVV